MTEHIKKILVLNGPNLNMLGKREPHLYGSLTLDDINRGLAEEGIKLGLSLDFFQSNHEGVLVDKIQERVEDPVDGLIINPGALTHTSVALRDALVMLTCPLVEIHLSNIHKREEFRRKSLLADVVTGQITGFGHLGYHMALMALARMVHGS